MAKTYQFDLLVPPDLSDEQLKYIQHLYDLSVPCVSERFPDDYCRVWTRAKNKDGYGAHRIPKHLRKHSTSPMHIDFYTKCLMGRLGREVKIKS